MIREANLAFVSSAPFKHRPALSALLEALLSNVVNAVLIEKVDRLARDLMVKREFAFSGIIRCGHCGCALVGKMKKNSYTYYHCTGYRGKCPERHTREETLSGRFASLLKGLSLDAEVLEWVKTALHQNHQDERRFHDEAVARLKAEYTRLQNRIDAAYIDKLDGRVDTTFFDRKALEWRGQQDRLLRLVEEHQKANQGYLAQGAQLLELAGRAACSKGRDHAKNGGC